MNILFKFIIVMALSVSHYAQDTHDYSNLINDYTTTWKENCLSQLSTQELATIADTILLSYQVVQASITMSQERLTIQSELLNLATLSINDTFDARMQAQNNDLTIIKNAIVKFEEAQNQVKFACDTLKEFGPLVIAINPKTIQTLITNLKKVMLHWAKDQNSTITDLENIKHEFMVTQDLFTNIKTVFDTIIVTDPIDQSQLLAGANSVTNTYHNIEVVIAHLTETRKKGIQELDKLLTSFFKYHYEALYDFLKNADQTSICLSATHNHKLPTPDDNFSRQSTSIIL